MGKSNRNHTDCYLQTSLNFVQQTLFISLITENVNEVRSLLSSAQPTVLFHLFYNIDI